MLLNVLEVPRGGKQANRTRKLLSLQCDECDVVFQRRWQREVAERLVHFCTVKHMAVWHAKQPGRNEVISRATSLAMHDPIVRQNFMDGLARRAVNPLFKQRLSQARQRVIRERPDVIQRAVATLKATYADPTFKAAFIERQNDLALRAFRSQRAITYWSDASNRAHMSTLIKASWASEMTGHGSPDWIARQREAQRNVWLDDSYRASHSGSRNPMAGTISPWWQPWMATKLDERTWAKTILRACDNRCLACGSKHQLEAHHIVPRATRPDLVLDINNGIALCMSCHRAAGPNSAHALLRADPDRYHTWIQSMQIIQPRGEQ